MTSFCKVSVTSVQSKIAAFGFVTNFIKERCMIKIVPGEGNKYISGT